MLFHKPLSKVSIYSFTCTKEKGKKILNTRTEIYKKTQKIILSHRVDPIWH